MKSTKTCDKCGGKFDIEGPPFNNEVSCPICGGATTI